MIHNLRAIVLWSRPGREADKIVGLYTDAFGRLTARATSAARAAAKFASLTEPFVESEMALHLTPGRGWAKIVGGRLIQSFPLLRTSLDRSTAASWICEVTYRLTPEEQPGPDKYALLRDALAALAGAQSYGVIRLAFAVRFLAMAGLSLEEREPWQRLQKECPGRALSLAQAPLADLGASAWEDSRLTDLEHLAGSVVADHLSRPLHVNRFRQMTGVLI